MATRSRVRVFCLALFFLAVACGYLQWYVRGFRSFKLEDSGIFLHIGQRLAHGDVLYRDIADNKPPLVYWLNEAGLRLSHGSPGGVFLFSLVAGLLTFASIYWGLKEYVSWRFFIIAGCWAQLAFLACSVHPNYTESFSLPLAALAGVLWIREQLESEHGNWYPLAQGAIAALLFSLRANNAGVSGIYFVYLLLGLRNGRIRQTMLFVAGGAGTYCLVLLPLAIQGILPDYLLNVFRLAAPYTGATSMGTRLRALWHGLHLFGTSPLFYISLTCLATVVLLYRSHRFLRVLMWLAAWLFVEMLLSSTSGYHWDHYYLLWIPPLALTLMLCGTVLFGRVIEFPVLTILVVVLTLILLNEAVLSGYRAKSYPRAEDPALALARPFLKAGDRVTTWGHFNHDIWYDLDHRPGTRWFHEGAFTNSKIYQALMPNFLEDLDRNRPRVVIERRSAVPLFAPSKPDEPLNDAFVADYFKDWDSPEIVKRKAELAQRYCPAVENTGVVIYLLCR